MTHILILLSLLVFLTMENESMCPNDDIRIRYKCSTKALLDDKCLSIMETTEEKDGNPFIYETYYLTKCDDANKQCKRVNSMGRGVDYGICFDKEESGFEGDKCKSNADCFSKKCQNKKCVALNDGDDCSRLYLGCSKSSACVFNDSDLLCTKIVAAEEVCFDDKMCPIDYACGKPNSGSVNKKCMKMFSIGKGKYSSNALLCKSGYIFTYDNSYTPHKLIYDSGENKCAESKLKATEEKCTTDEDCQYTISDGSGNDFNAKGSCICSSNSDDNYCDIDTNNVVWQNWLTTYSTEMQNVKADEDIKSYQYEREKNWNFLINQAYLNKTQYAKLKNADECTIKYFTTGIFIKISSMLMILLIPLLF